MAGHLDGNALGGILGEAFGREVTMAVGTCGHCGAVGVLAEQVVYVDAPASVVRCRSCGNVLARVGRVAGRIRLELRGVRVLELPDDSP